MHRTQILFPHWLNEYIDISAKKCAISKGELIRCMTSMSILIAMNARGKTTENFDKLMEAFKEIQKNCDAPDPEKIAVFHDDLYYETRKAVENRLSSIKKAK